MKAVVVTKPGELLIAEQPKPTLGAEDHLLIRVRAAGICGSDISIYKGTSPVATYPRVIGHEFAGEVVEVGARASGFSVGDHVSINPVNSCGECRVCRKGRGNVCEHLEVTGVHADGGYREFASIPAKNAFKVPKTLPWEHAAIVEPYTVAAQVISRGGVQAGDRVLILGCGQIAITILQVCKILGADCIMTDLVDGRLARAKQHGASAVINSGKEDVPARVKELTGGDGVDVAIDAACVGQTLEQAVKCTRAAGVVVTMGFGERLVPATELEVTKKELEIRGSRLNYNKFPQVIEWFADGKLDPSTIITDQIPFTEVLTGFDKIKNHAEETMKVVLTFE